MFPAFRQRVWIVAASVIGGLVWLAATGFVRAGDLSPGLTLTQSHSGAFVAGLMLLICGLPAMLGALLVSVTGKRLSGPFVLGTALCFVAIAGGSSWGFFWRSAERGARLVSGAGSSGAGGDVVRGVYGYLMLETLAWAAGLIALFVAFSAAEPWVGKWLPRWLFSPPHAQGQAAGDSERADAKAAVNADAQRQGETELETDTDDAKLDAGFGYTHSGLFAGLVSTLIGAVAASLLLARGDIGQVIGGLGMAFIAAGLLTRLLVGQSNPTFVLLSPAAVAMVAYGWVWLGPGHQESVLAAWYDNELLGAALALPIHYFSAGLAGVSAGFGLGHALMTTREAGE